MPQVLGMSSRSVGCIYWFCVTECAHVQTTLYVIACRNVKFLLLHFVP